MTTLLYTHPDCLDHDPGPSHPECPDRLRAIMTALDAPAFAALDRREAPRATLDQVALMHPRAHVERTLARIPDVGQAQMDGDTVVSPGSGEAALRATGAVCAAVDAIMRDEADNAFCAVRPPGHHAEATVAMGFCVFNSVAVAAAHARQAHGINRVAVIDFDVHHGNGTQHLFESDADLFYGSTHQSPLYPGTGGVTERGVGNIVNAPLPPFAGSDAFRQAMRERILPALSDFRPELLLISAGFDAHADDPLAMLALEDDDYAWATRELMRAADQTCDGRVVSALEGGYDLDALARSVAVHVAVLMTSDRLATVQDAQAPDDDSPGAMTARGQ